MGWKPFHPENRADSRRVLPAALRRFGNLLAVLEPLGLRHTSLRSVGAEAVKALVVEPMPGFTVHLFDGRVGRDDQQQAECHHSATARS